MVASIKLYLIAGFCLGYLSYSSGKTVFAADMPPNAALSETDAWLCLNAAAALTIWSGLPLRRDVSLAVGDSSWSRPLPASCNARTSAPVVLGAYDGVSGAVKGFVWGTRSRLRPLPCNNMLV